MSDARPWHLDMSLVQDKLDKLALALVNKIEREWPPRFSHLPFAQGFFGMTVRLARHTYRAVFYLCADQRLGESDWRWSYTLVLPPINRTLLDAVFNVIFILEDLEQRSAWYHKSGWKEAEREYARCSDRYGTDPQWSRWFEGQRRLLDQGAREFAVAPQELGGKPDWPNPGRMVYFGVDPRKLPPERQFLQYLNDWFYREISAQNHQSFFGFMRLGALLLADAPGLDDSQKSTIESDFYPKHRAVHVSRCVTLLLCLVSEIEHYFNFGLAPRVVDLWVILAERVPEAREVYEKRYAAFWPTVAA